MSSRLSNLFSQKNNLPINVRCSTHSSSNLNWKEGLLSACRRLYTLVAFVLRFYIFLLYLTYILLQSFNVLTITLFMFIYKYFHFDLIVPLIVTKLCFCIFIWHIKTFFFYIKNLWPIVPLADTYMRPIRLVSTYMQPAAERLVCIQNFGIDAPFPEYI